MVYFCMTFMTETQQILARIIPLTMQLGVRAVTMQQIAKELGISKKTLYQYFESKADLVHQMVQFHIAMEREMMQKIIEGEKNAIDEIIEIGQHVIQHLRQVNPTSIYDLKRLYPKTWKLFDEHKLFIAETIHQNLEKGIKQGWYRSDFNIEIITRLYVSKIDAIIDITVFPAHFSKADIYKEMLKYHIHGVANEKGETYFNRYLQNSKQAN